MAQRIALGLDYTWRNTPSLPEKELRARNAELERMVGRLTMENDLLKKAVEYTLRRRKENSSPITAKSLAASKGGVK